MAGARGQPVLAGSARAAQKANGGRAGKCSQSADAHGLQTAGDWQKAGKGVQRLELSAAQSHDPGWLCRRERRIELRGGRSRNC